ncbi:MAG: hypothetical protein KF862_27440 [Chitinophagaceae bacterium]|nr:hypothetical protein [Chitinophagaceae bacterium]
MKLHGTCSAIVLCILMQLYHPAIAQQEKAGAEPLTYRYFNQLRQDVSWQLVDSVPLHFTTYHTQGLTRAGNFYFLSSVKVNRWPKKYPAPVDGFDRDPGDGTGYLFKFGMDGRLTDSVCLGENGLYHPGGIDFDGTYIWVPVCEYRPFGKSFIYRVHPETLEAVLVATLPDAIGAVAYNRATNELTGMNWGSRVFYKWKIRYTKGTPRAELQKEKGTNNPHFYVDFQDCNYAGNNKMICSGLRVYKNVQDVPIRLGGLELIDMDDYTAGLQLPVNKYTGKGIIITNNPFYIEEANGMLQYYFIPEDDASVLYIYRLQ